MSTEDYSMPVVVISIGANKSKRGLRGKSTAVRVFDPYVLAGMKWDWKF